jgi:hypothetical protein
MNAEEDTTMTMETPRSRFLKVMRGEMPSDRLPVLEWATWWDKTINRWKTEGLPQELDWPGVKRYFSHDMDHQAWLPAGIPPEAFKPAGDNDAPVAAEADYDRIRSLLYPTELALDMNYWKAVAAEQATGQAVVWITLNGFFWWPRVLFGIERHLFAFYDQRDLMHRMNQDNVENQLVILDKFCKEICTPDFMTFAEDMSYNHGPMISKPLFDEFLTPYYHQIIPALKSRGIIPIIDSDGDVEPLIPWFEEAGLEGILPLERMAGVDVNRIRANHPQWKMIGGFDKTTMHLGEARMRQEFERLLPAMKSGYYIPSVDHQTPPGVSLENYRLYMKLMWEYAEKACK